MSGHDMLCDLDIVEVNNTRGRSTDSALVFFLANDESFRVTIDDEARDATITLQQHKSYIT